jgi:hypothetical protein
MTVSKTIYTADTVEELVALLKALDIDNDWITWNGGRSPVSYETRVEYRIRGDDKTWSSKAKTLTWEHAGKSWDIVSYRVIK